jgi:hypothetical protein
MTAAICLGRGNYLVPVRALSVGFRARLLARCKRLLPHVVVPPAVWKKRWVVYAKPTVQGEGLVLRYLACYVHRVAITDARIVLVDATTVTFRYQDATARAGRTMTLPGDEFLRRFLQHVLPRGFHKVRYYGFWRPRAAETRTRLQRQLAPGSRVALVPPEPPRLRVPPVPLCARCGRGHVYRTRRLVRTRDVIVLAQPP